MKNNEIINVLPNMIDIEYDGINFNEALRKSATQSRILRILSSKENNWLKPLFDAYKSGNDRSAFVQKLNDMADKHGVDINIALYGILDIDILLNVFDAIDRIKPDEDLSIPAPTKELKMVTDNAENVCVMVDSVAKEISFDRKMRGGYNTGTDHLKKIVVNAELKKLDSEGRLITNDKGKRVESLNRWLPFYTYCADMAVLETLSEIDEKSEFLSTVTESMKDVVEKDEKWFENSRKQPSEEGNVARPTFEEEEKLIEFGKVYPRATPQSKIAKELQPYNIKVGIKFLNAIIDAFNDVLVREK